jgi:hypothetical protein
MTVMMRRRALAVAVTLAAFPGAAWGDANRSASFEDRDGTNGKFVVDVRGEGGGPHRVKAEFEQAFFSLGTLELRDWHVSIQFFDEGGKRYKVVDQPNAKGPSASGKFEWPPQENFTPQRGKLTVSLFETRGQMQRLADVEFGIGGPKATDVEFLPNVEKIMRNKGWQVGAALHHRWLIEPENQLVGKQEEGKGTKRKLSIDDKTVKMDWVLKFPRAKEKYDELLKQATNEPGRRVLLKHLQAELKKHPKEGKEHSKEGKEVSFGDFSKHDLALFAQAINSRPVGSGHGRFGRIASKVETAGRVAAEGLDDMDAALFSFNLLLVPKGKATRTAKGWDVKISELGVFVFDSYDFNGGEDLGWWKMPDEVKPPHVFPLFQPGYVHVTNDLYRAYRTRHKRGGDFLVISDVKVTKAQRHFTIKDHPGKDGTPPKKPQKTEPKKAEPKKPGPR